jgi:predicted transcriptional regulator
MTSTKIMFKSYLSYSQLVTYLPLLEARGLITHSQLDGQETEPKFYHVTQKGIKFMQAYNEISELVPRINAIESTS